MGSETSSASGEPVAGGADPMEELFFHAFVQKDDDTLESRVHFSATPNQLMQILMTNPEVLPDK